MNSNIANKEYNFKDLEEKIYDLVCRYGQEILKEVIKQTDEGMHKEIKHLYRNKGYAETTVKTKLGEVRYRRHKYIKTDEKGISTIIIPLDEKIKIKKIGLYSENMVSNIINTVTKVSFRETAKIISDTTNERISFQAVWNIVQKVGEKIQQEEKEQVEKMYALELKPQKEVAVLFEEEDGVWLKMQNKKHKKIGSQELKIGTIYEGVRKENGRRKLVGKKVYAGLEQAEIFHEKKESKIESIYKTNLIQTRILNGDGAKWIQEDVSERNRIYQLDRFHVHQAINRGINVDKEVAIEVRRLYNKCEIEEMLRQIKIYADSTDNGEKFDTRSEKARELLAYLSNNKESLIPYYKRNLKLPKLPEGLKYARMGVQENQNCTVITMRMSGGRKRWSQKGGNNFAKILYTKENDELKYDDIKTIKTKEKVKNIVKQTIQKYTINKYYDVFNAHVPLREAARTPAMNAFLEACF